MSPRDITLALVVVVVWGLNFIAIRWGVDLVPPLLLTALRYIFAALPAVFLIRPPKVSLRLLLFYGFAVGVMQFGSLFVAIKLGMPAGLSSLIIQMQAFFTLGFAAIALGERLGRAQALGAALALVGVLVIAAERFGSAGLVPLLLTLLGAAFWGLSNIAVKRAGQIDMLAFVVWASLVPPIPLLLASFATEGVAADWAALSHPSWLLAGSIAFNSYGATLLGFGLWSVLLKRYPASLVAPFSLLVPVVGIAAAAILLHEPLAPLEAVGSAIIFLGLLVNVFGPKLTALTKMSAG